MAAYDQSAYNPGGTTNSTANPGWVFGYAVGSGGALTLPPTALTRPASSPRHRLRPGQPVRLCHRLRLQRADRVHHPEGGALTSSSTAPSRPATSPPASPLTRAAFTSTSPTRSIQRSRHTASHSPPALPRPSSTATAAWSTPLTPTRRHRRRSRAWPLRLHRQPARQLRLRLPPRSQYRCRGCYSGHSIPHRRQSHFAGCCSPRKPLRAVGLAVNERAIPKQKAQPSRPGFFVDAFPTPWLLSRLGCHFSPIPCE